MARVASCRESRVHFMHGSSSFATVRTTRAVARERTAATETVQFASLTGPSGMRVTLTTADAIAARVTRVARTADPRTVVVQLAMGGFTENDEPTFLKMTPLPDDGGSADDAMRELHERARERIGDVRARWRARATSGETVLVKMRAMQGDVGEYVWLEVLDWRDGTLDGNVATPAPRVGLGMVQRLTLDESQVYDQLVKGPPDPAVYPFTDMVATDYGMDV